MKLVRLTSHLGRTQKVIVVDADRAILIENTAIDVLTRKENFKKWQEYSTETLEDQQELYLESLCTFDSVPVEDMPDEAAEYFFNLCVYLAVFRRLLQAKRAGLPPIPLLLIK